MAKKFVYFFGGGKAEGNTTMKNLLGGKGANLAEMAGHKDLRLPVPPGFTISTEVCTIFNENKQRFPKELQGQVETAIRKVEKVMNKKFGDPKNPLLVSVRSGARVSMPGMMETVLNVGLTSKTLPGLAQRFRSERFAYDAYRRLITMYADVVMEKSEGIRPKEGQGVRPQLEKFLHNYKNERGIEFDKDLSVDDLKLICEKFKELVKKILGKPFPDDHEKQLWGGIRAVFYSWSGKKAVSYRTIEGIPHEWGTAVNVQSMAFGNTGDNSSTGVAFTRNPGNGENQFYGEFLINALGEDVVAGTRTPSPINEYSRSDQNRDHKTLHQLEPKIYKQLDEIRRRLEKHYKDMQDVEFTIEEGELFMLQCRVGKRNGPAAVRMAVDMVKEKLIDRETAVMRVKPSQLDELLHPVIDPAEEEKAEQLGSGLPAGPGGASGQIVFTSEDAVKWFKEGNRVILLREETNPEDVEGMRASEAILTARGGMTSHAALVARGWGKCCVVGCADLDIDYLTRSVTVGGQTLREGDWITLNGNKGTFYRGHLPTIEAAEDNPYFTAFLKICDSVKTLKVRTNGDTPADAHKARVFGAEGIGLFRTEHMFYGKNSEEPLFKLRKMIMSKDETERRKALDELFPHVKSDLKATFSAMNGYPVTVRLLDPPLHEFVPTKKEGLEELAGSLGISLDELQKRTAALHEVNPMMGHRGVRLGVTYPEMTEMQVRAILEAAAELKKEGAKVIPEIMVPVVSSVEELKTQREIVDTVYKEVCKKYSLKSLTYLFGTMIEIPRACLTADDLAEVADFFSFGTNDLTQMTFGFSRDDIGGFLPDYLEKEIIPGDPFQSIDVDGVGQLIEVGVELGRMARPKLKIGICGEHGGDPASVEFCQNVGMDYVSCSPFRVPIARLSAAQAAVRSKQSEAAVKKTASKPKKRSTTTKKKTSAPKKKK